MSPQNKNEKENSRPSPFLQRKGRHNLLFYLCLLVIACIFIIAAPSQAAGGNGSAQPGQLTVSKELVYQEHFTRPDASLSLRDIPMIVKFPG